MLWCQCFRRLKCEIMRSDPWCGCDPEQVVTFYSSKVAELQESMPELLTSAEVLSQEEPEDESTSPAQQVTASLLTLSPCCPGCQQGGNMTHGLAETLASLPPVCFTLFVSACCDGRPPSPCPPSNSWLRQHVRRCPSEHHWPTGQDLALRAVTGH